MQLRKIFTPKKIILYVIVILVAVAIGGQIYKSRHNTDNIFVDEVKKQDLRQTVLATGQVVSGTDLNLSFQSTGVAAKVGVAVGDKVKTGQVLASLDQKTQAAAVAQAQANYDKVVAGATNEEIEVSRAAVAAAEVTADNAATAYEAAKTQQTVAVSNAYLAMLNSGLTANRVNVFDTTFTATISGTYTGGATGEYKITITSTGYGTYYYRVTGLEDEMSRVITRGLPLPLGSRGLSVTFSAAGTITEVDSWSVPIPNTQASTYVTNYNAWLAAKETQNQTLTTARNTINAAKIALDQARAALALKQAAARPEDIAVARAQLLSAQAALANMIIVAPASGTITKVDIKVGQLASAQSAVLTLQDVGNLHLEANVSEANIAEVAIGQGVDVTFDAFGSEKNYSAKVQAIDPASTVTSGVVNYKITALMDGNSAVRPGMTANMTILTAEKTGVLAVPQRAIIAKDGKRFVRVVTDGAKKTYEEREVGVGLLADQGLAEIVSGLSEGQKIVTYIKTK